jgi:hypothetical protein
MTDLTEIEFLATLARIERGEATVQDVHWLRNHEANLRQSIVLLRARVERLEAMYRDEVRASAGVLTDED